MKRGRVKVIGFIKELTVPPHYYKNWIRFLNECDYIVAPATANMQKLPVYTEIQSWKKEIRQHIDYDNSLKALRKEDRRKK